MIARIMLAALACLALAAPAAHGQVSANFGVAVMDWAEPDWDPHLSSVTDATPDTLATSGRPYGWIRVYAFGEDVYVLTNRCEPFGTCGTIDTADTLRVPVGIPWTFTMRCDSLVIGVYDGSGTTNYQVETQPARF